MSLKFIENPNGFQEASTNMNKLIRSSWKKNNLKAQFNSIDVCVSGMRTTEEKRVACLKKESDKIRAEKSREAYAIYQEKMRGEKGKSMQEIHIAMAKIQDDIPNIQRIGDMLEKSPKRSKLF